MCEVGGLMPKNFITVESPINGRQYFYYIVDNNKKYTYSIPEEQFDSFVKYEEELDKRLNALKDIDTKELVNNLEQNNIRKKAKLFGAASGIIAGGIPLIACLKFIKGTKSYIIGSISAAVLGIAGAITGYIGSLGSMIEKAGLKTTQGQALKEIYKTRDNYDVKLEKIESI